MTAWKRLDKEMIGLAATCAIGVTIVDAVLLELRRDYFTGGFLSEDSATAWSDRLAFLAGSVASDAALVILGVASALLLAGRLQLGRAARWFLAVILGAGPLLVASAIEYQVVAQLGDAFDFHLMFDLVGGRPSEILAVAAGHLWAPVFVLAAGLAAVVISTALLQRWSGLGSRRQLIGPLVRQLVVITLAGLALTTTLRVLSDVLDYGLRRKPSGQALGALVGAVTDVDRDGYGLLSRPPDQAPFDPAIYPYALDIPGNGVDEDGVGGDLPPGPLYTVLDDTPPRFLRTPDIVFVMLESFRGDLVGQHVNGREVTPTLNRLAREGASSADAYSHNGYTVQSRFHALSGTLMPGLSKTALIDDFKANGYRVAYFSGQDESFGSRDYEVGLQRADTFYDARQDVGRRFSTFTTPGSLGVPADVVVERVSRFLAATSNHQPLLIYISLYDTHFPYHHDAVPVSISHARLQPGDIVPRNASVLREMYANTAAYVDATVGRVLSLVGDVRGVDPAVLVMADHGESLFDEGFLGHGYALNRAQTRIPFVVNGLPLTMCEPVGQSDVRAALRDALSRAETDPHPRFSPCAGHSVFQYLGDIRRPRQIALTRADSFIAYDFRRRRVLTPAGANAPADLSASDQANLFELVHTWERMMLAAYSAGVRQ